MSAIQEKSVEKAFVYQTLSSSIMQELRATMGRTGNVVEMAIDEDDAGAAAIEEKSDLDESKPLREQIEALKKEKGGMKKALAEKDKQMKDALAEKAKEISELRRRLRSSDPSATRTRPAEQASGKD